MSATSYASPVTDSKKTTARVQRARPVSNVEFDFVVKLLTVALLNQAQSQLYNYPFKPVNWMPSMKYRWAKKKIKIIGRMAITDADMR